MWLWLARLVSTVVSGIIQYNTIQHNSCTYFWVKFTKEPGLFRYYFAHKKYFDVSACNILFDWQSTKINW